MNGEDWAVDTINYALLIAIALVTLYPFYYVLVLSFNEGQDVAHGGIYLWPRKFTLENYVYFFSNPRWLQAFQVSVLRTAVGTALSLAATCLTAYGLSHNGLVFKKLYFMLVIVAMYVSGGIIAYYVVLRGLGLLNTFAVYVVPSAVNIFFLLIAISFFREIPSELGESARIDGANELLILWRIVLPVSLPLLATMSLFIGTGQWNSWLDSAFFVQSESLRTLSYRMIEIVNQAEFAAMDAVTSDLQARSRVTPLAVRVTAMIVTIVPIICVYPFLQKYFVQGMMLGSVKG